MYPHKNESSIVAKWYRVKYNKGKKILSSKSSEGSKIYRIWMPVLYCSKLTGTTNSVIIISVTFANITKSYWFSFQYVNCFACAHYAQHHQQYTSNMTVLLLLLIHRQRVVISNVHHSHICRTMWIDLS